jgi:chorismate mutase/prephenate dehydratase
MRTIEEWRNSIDAIDRELLCLLNRRAELALEAGRAKLNAGLPICDGAREREVIDRSCRINAGPLDKTAITNIFRRIIHETRSFEMRRVNEIEEVQKS